MAKTVLSRFVNTDYIVDRKPESEGAEVLKGGKQKHGRVIVYTDGGCDPNPGVGGWAAVLLYKDRRKELSGAEPCSTNNRMELTAAIEALRALKRPCAVEMHTDSEYLRKGITVWLPNWKRRGWKRNTGSLKNADLWKELDDLAQRHDIQWQWVEGHAGIPENERCDILARNAIFKLKQASVPGTK
ncbi:MAG: ribonuclease HI [Candidatus Hydrogenedentes bacterium]|nr:ribonuclease HI [Candidatus Hydrogenedentota bacterium]